MLTISHDQESSEVQVCERREEESWSFLWSTLSSWPVIRSRWRSKQPVKVSLFTPLPCSWNFGCGDDKGSSETKRQTYSGNKPMYHIIHELDEPVWPSNSTWWTSLCIIEGFHNLKSHGDMELSRKITEINGKEHRNNEITTNAEKKTTWKKENYFQICPYFRR